MAYDGTDRGERIRSGSAVYSALARLGARGRQLVVGSWLYRWLTAEPEPDVIVIDLRETWTVGPVVRLLDRAIEIAVPLVQQSTTAAGCRAAHERLLEAPLRVGGIVAVAVGVTVAALSAVGGSAASIVAGLVVAFAGLLAARDDRSWARLRETAVVETLLAAFEPPEPPRPKR